MCLLKAYGRLEIKFHLFLSSILAGLGLHLHTLGKGPSYLLQRSMNARIVCIGSTNTQSEGWGRQQRIFNRCIVLSNFVIYKGTHGGKRNKSQCFFLHSFRAVFLNCRAAASYWAAVSIISGRVRFSGNSSF